MVPGCACYCHHDILRCSMGLGSGRCDYSSILSNGKDVHQRILLIHWNRFGTHKPTWFPVPFGMHIFCLSQLYFMLPDYKSAFFSKMVFCLLLLYICHLGPCFGSGHCSPFGDPTLIDFIWIVGSSSGSLGFSTKSSAQSRQLVTGSHALWGNGLFACNVSYWYVPTLFVLMIGKLLCKNFECMAIKIFWHDLTWYHVLWKLKKIRTSTPIILSAGSNSCQWRLYATTSCKKSTTEINTDMATKLNIKL